MSNVTLTPTLTGNDTVTPTPTLTGNVTVTDTPTLTPTNNTDVEVIRLPTYKGNDPVDEIFIVVVIVFVVVIVGACLQYINKRKRREKSERTRRLRDAELEVNEENGETNIRLNSFTLEDTKD